MAIGIILFNHNNCYLYFRECPSHRAASAVISSRPLLALGENSRIVPLG